MNKSLFRNAYHLNSFLYFNEKVKLSLVNETDLDDDFFSERIDDSKFKLDKDSFDCKLRVFVNRDLKEDGYKIYIKKGNIELSSANTRGMIYAINYLNDFCEVTESGFKLPIAFV